MTATVITWPGPLRLPALPGRRFGSPGIDAVLRATAAVALIAIPIVLWVPESAALIPLVLSTLWMRGPFSAFIPVGLEPVLMFYGRIYQPWLVTLVAAAASAYAEVVSLHLMRGLVSMRRLEGIRGSIRVSRVMRLFERHPALAIALTALSPIPDWITRTLAAVSRYPVARYVVADTIGRIPKLFVPAALGALLHIPNAWLIGTVVGSMMVGAVAASFRWWQNQSRAVAGAACPGRE